MVGAHSTDGPPRQGIARVAIQAGAGAGDEITDGAAGDGSGCCVRDLHDGLGARRHHPKILPFTSSATEPNSCRDSRVTSRLPDTEATTRVIKGAIRAILKVRSRRPRCQGGSSESRPRSHRVSGSFT